jgi:hypothetical protein
VNNDEFLKILQETIDAEQPGELSDAVVDAFLSVPSPRSPETEHRIEAKFVAKLFADLHREPVKNLAAKWPFNRWLEAIRESLRLTRLDVAAALGREVEFVESLENGDRLPWDFTPSDIGDVISLFRVHMTAVTELIANSFTVFNSPGVEAVARAHHGRMSEKRGRSTRRALDLYVARNAPVTEPGAEVLAWLKDVRTELDRRQRHDLI